MFGQRECDVGEAENRRRREIIVPSSGVCWQMKIISVGKITFWLYYGHLLWNFYGKQFFRVVFPVSCWLAKHQRTFRKVSVEVEFAFHLKCFQWSWKIAGTTWKDSHWVMKKCWSVKWMDKLVLRQPMIRWKCQAFHVLHESFGES